MRPDQLREFGSTRGSRSLTQRCPTVSSDMNPPKRRIRGQVSTPPFTATLYRSHNRSHSPPKSHQMGESPVPLDRLEIRWKDTSEA
jgi:hypothetical protein